MTVITIKAKELQKNDTFLYNGLPYRTVIDVSPIQEDAVTVEFEDGGEIVLSADLSVKVERQV